MISCLFAQASGMENIVSNNGISIAIAGMIIVFSALTIISLFIAFLPKLLDVLDPYLPKVQHSHAAPAVQESLPSDEEQIVAAIGFVLHSEIRKSGS